MSGCGHDWVLSCDLLSRACGVCGRVQLRTAPTDARKWDTIKQGAENETEQEQRTRIGASSDSSTDGGVREAERADRDPTDASVQSGEPDKRPTRKDNENKMTPDMVNNPPHYTSHPSGVECIDITRHMGFNLGNAVKYIWRCDLKRDALEDLEKAVFYLQDEIKRRAESV